MNKKRWIIVIAIVLLAGLGYVGYSLVQGPQVREAAAQTSEDVAVVERGTLRVTVDASGSLAPNDEVTLAFLSSGRVAEVTVKEGDEVQAGDVLARLDDADARQSVADAEVQVRQAEINLASARIEAEAGLKQANLASAQAAYNESSALAARTGDQLTSARVNLKQALDRLANAQEDYTTAWDPARDWELYTFRQNALENERESTGQELQDAQDNLEIAQADYNLAVAGISQRDVQDAQANVLKAQVAMETEGLDWDIVAGREAKPRSGPESVAKTQPRGSARARRAWLGVDEVAKPRREPPRGRRAPTICYERPQWDIVAGQEAKPRSGPELASQTEARRSALG